MVDHATDREGDLRAVPASCKVGLQFERRFWEEDEAIYGGITYTDLPTGRFLTRALATMSRKAFCSPPTAPNSRRSHPRRA